MRDLRAIAARLGRRAAQLQEQELIEGQEPGPYLLARTPYWEVRAALQLKEALLAEFAGARLEEVYQGVEAETEFGPVLRLEDYVPQRVSLCDRRRSLRALASQLRLVYGIGPRIERELQERGYRTLEDLQGHPRFGEEATRLCETLKHGDLPQLAAAVEHWFSPSHPLMLAIAGLAERIALFDLESLGLFGRPLVLLGLAWPEDEGLRVEQYLIRSITEELAAVTAAAEALERAGALVTYNGRAFDLNYLEERLSYYGISRWIGRPDLDLLYHARRRFGARLPDCRLGTVERYLLGRERPFDVPSALVPDFYNTYLEEGNIGPLVAIIEHNRQDLLSLAALLGRLCSGSMGGQDE